MNHNDVTITGPCDARFYTLRETLHAVLRESDEWGGGIALRMEGRTLFHLTGGYADRARQTAIAPDTHFGVFSCSKAVSSVAIALLVQDGELDYDQPIASLWPEFAAHGKGAVTIGDLLSHQAGLSGIPNDWSAEAFFDREATAKRLAGMAPLWDLSEGGSGYHPITWGYLIDEVVRRATGVLLAEHLHTRITKPLNIAFTLGVPEGARLAGLRKPPSPPDLGELNAPTRAAFVNTWYSPGLVRGRDAWSELALPSAAGFATAEGLAMALEPYARGGKLGASRLLTHTVTEAAMEERVAGPDRVLPFALSFGAGMICNRPGNLYYGPGTRTVGHTGFGGSCVLADPEAGLSFAYVTNALSPALVEDERAKRLILAVYDCLD
jgi:CubicO group peptidase (beta-lactamase class C family)